MLRQQSQNKPYSNTSEDTFGRTKTMNYILHCTEDSNSPLTKTTKLMPEINKLSVSIHLSWHVKNENRSRERWFKLFPDLYFSLLFFFSWFSPHEKAARELRSGEHRSLSSEKFFLIFLFSYLSSPLRKKKNNQEKPLGLGKKWFWLACEHNRILVESLKLFRLNSIDGAN